MSDRLESVLQVFIDERGPAGLAILSDAVNRSPVTIQRWIRVKRVPKTSDAVRMLVATGMTDENARALARAESEGARESA